MTKARGESHLALLATPINKAKGEWFSKSTPSTGTSKQLKFNRRSIRNAVGVFVYLKWTPPTSSSEPFPTVEPIWNKSMHVSNWIDLVCYAADKQIAWAQADGPKDTGGGTPSLRALWAYFIEDELNDIERRAASWSKDAAEFYKKGYGTSRGEPAWYDSAFGRRGWATASQATFPRVPVSGGGWSKFGAFANKGMTLDGMGNEVTLGALSRIV